MQNIKELAFLLILSQAIFVLLKKHDKKYPL